MDKEEQINDIAKIIGDTNMTSGSSEVHIAFINQVATKIHNAGYKKQELDVKNWVRELIDCFSGLFINGNNELILDNEANLYFLLDNVENELDLKCKVLEFCSRDAFKATPFETDYRNTSYQNRIRENINDFLKTNFSQEEIEKIYIKLGNRINHAKTIKFVESGYDFKVLN